MFTLLILTVIVSFAQSQGIDSLNTVLKAMAKNNIYEVSFTVGFSGTISEQYQHFKQLLSLATSEQLLDIAAHNKNAVVRLYAYQALKQNKIKIPGILIQQFQDDINIVKTHNGCKEENKSVNALAQQNIKSLPAFEIRE